MDAGAEEMDSEEAALVAAGETVPLPPPQSQPVEESKAGDVVVEADDEDEGPIKVRYSVFISAGTSARSPRNHYYSFYHQTYYSLDQSIPVTFTFS